MERSRKRRRENSQSGDGSRSPKVSPERLSSVAERKKKRKRSEVEVEVEGKEVETKEEEEEEEEEERKRMNTGKCARSFRAATDFSSNVGKKATTTSSDEVEAEGAGPFVDGRLTILRVSWALCVAILSAHF